MLEIAQMIQLLAQAAHTLETVTGADAVQKALLDKIEELVPKVWKS